MVQVVLAVKGEIPVLVDGGLRRGTDVFKALALGAQGVLVRLWLTSISTHCFNIIMASIFLLFVWQIGRPVIYGLAAKGEYGVRQVIEMLKDELELTMALSGCPTLKDITRSRVSLGYERLQCKI